MVLSAENKMLVSSIGLFIESFFAVLAACASTLLLVASIQSRYAFVIEECEKKDFRTLRSSCNIMIAFCALFDATHSVSWLLHNSEQKVRPDRVNIRNSRIVR